jgi:hypothetical protein
MLGVIALGPADGPVATPLNELPRFIDMRVEILSTAGLGRRAACHEREQKRRANSS